jgi:hypothetical protein
MPPRAALMWSGAPEPMDGETRGADKMHGGGPFYSRALHGGNADLCKERERDVAVAAALRGGDVEGVCPYAVGEEVSWTGGESMQPHDTHGCASAWCLRGEGLGSWRLDGPHTVSARKEEAKALCETSLSSSWCWHLDHEVMAQQSSGKATMQWR